MTQAKADCGRLAEWRVDSCCSHCHERCDFHLVRLVATNEVLRLCCSAVFAVFGDEKYRPDVEEALEEGGAKNSAVPEISRA